MTACSVARAAHSALSGPDDAGVDVAPEEGSAEVTAQILRTLVRRCGAPCRRRRSSQAVPPDNPTMWSRADRRWRRTHARSRPHRTVTVVALRWEFLPLARGWWMSGWWLRSR